MAFVQPTTIPTHRANVLLSTCRVKLNNSNQTTTRLRTSRQLTPHETAPSQSTVQTPTASVSPIPESFEIACDEARAAMFAALSAGRRRIFIDLDTTNGDATYTTLKTATPTVFAIAKSFDTDTDGSESSGTIQIVFPDAGAAALAKRDWEKEAVRTTGKFKIVGLEQYEQNIEDQAIILAVPRASEVEKLSALVREAAGVPVIIINPDLVDMGVTGLSLNARTLRTEIIDSFDSVYFLRVSPWGVLLRTFPDKWGVWIDDANDECGFRLIASLDERPGAIQIDEILDEEFAASGDAGGFNPFAKAVKGFKRFLNVYTKG